MGQAESKDDSRLRVGFFHYVNKEDLKPGDHIYCYRMILLYSHHGIYIGKPDCEVIHFSGDTKGSKSSAALRKCTLSEFLDGDELHLVSYDEPFLLKFLKKSESSRCLKSDSPSTVIVRAERLLHNPEMWGDYNVLLNNCEGFAFYCKTGIPVDPGGQAMRLKGLNFIAADMSEALASYLQETI